MCQNGSECPMEGQKDPRCDLLRQRATDLGKAGDIELLLVFSASLGVVVAEVLANGRKVVAVLLGHLQDVSMRQNGQTYRETVRVGEEASPTSHGLNTVPILKLEEPRLIDPPIFISDRREAAANYTTHTTL